MGYALRRRTTEADWDIVDEENPLARQMRTARRKTEAVIQGFARVAYLSGGAGVGKSHAISEAIQATGARVLRAVPDDYRQLIKLFDRSQGKVPLVLEECDHILRSLRSLNILKLATDSAGAQEMEVYVPPKKRSQEGTHKMIRLTAPICVALNGDLTNDKEWPRECIPHIRALRDREAPFNIQADAEAWWEYAVFLALRKGMLRKTEDRQHDIPLRIQNKAIQWFTENAWRQTNLSPRRLVKIAGVMMNDHTARIRSQRLKTTFDPRALAEDLEHFLKPHCDDERPAPFAPPIFYAPTLNSRTLVASGS